jgi:hypothetical protein
VDRHRGELSLHDLLAQAVREAVADAGRQTLQQTVERVRNALAGFC